MSEKIIVPALGESITEATVAKWIKKVGDTVEADEPIVELETDKVNLEVPSPVTGILEEINVKDGATIEVGTTLGSVKENDLSETKHTIKKIQPKEEVPSATEKIIEEAEEFSKNDNDVISTKFLNENKNIIKEEPVILKDEEKPLILTDEVVDDEVITSNGSLSPAVRKIVNENNIDVKKIKGSGKEGRILKGDLIHLMNIKPKPNQRKIDYGEEERIKMTRLRLTIAKRLKEAQENAAMLTTFNEVDMSMINDMRAKYQENFKTKFGIKLGYMSFFIKACVNGLRSYPAINAEIENDEIIYKNYYNLSFAVGTDKGLVVPVIRNADELSFADIEKNILKLSEKARSGKLSIEDLQGGTFTISNGGIYGSMLSTPILNLPQSGVLGMHNIVKRPVVINDEIQIRPIMYLALSYDHRIIDGKEAVSFLKLVKENLEDPRGLFLDL
ncbi:MAG: 2-oxoglutarate dehydrogenase complex dihydrolipoyllysine-residue succinyltransferase [Candidatus Pelagibacter sp.]